MNLSSYVIIVCSSQNSGFIETILMPSLCDQLCNMAMNVYFVMFKYWYMIWLLKLLTFKKMSKNWNSQPWKANRVQWGNKTRESQASPVRPGAPACCFQIKLGKFPNSLLCILVSSTKKRMELGPMSSGVLDTSYTYDSGWIPQLHSLLRPSSLLCKVSITEAASEPPSGSNSTPRILTVGRTGQAYLPGIYYHRLPNNSFRGV